MDFSIRYQKYMESEEWQKKRKWVLEFWDYKCALCFSGSDLEVHHRTYLRLGQEKLTDLIVLCEKCHERHHPGLGRMGLVPIEDALIVTANKVVNRWHADA